MKIGCFYSDLEAVFSLSFTEVREAVIMNVHVYIDQNSKSGKYLPHVPFQHKSSFKNNITIISRSVNAFSRLPFYIKWFFYIAFQLLNIIFKQRVFNIL